MKKKLLIEFDSAENFIRRLELITIFPSLIKWNPYKLKDFSIVSGATPYYTTQILNENQIS